MRHRPQLYRDREAVADKPATWTVVCHACDPNATHKVGLFTVRGALLRERLPLLDAAPIGEAHEREHAA